MADRFLWNSIFCLSPFGFGEICFRDFEIFISGGLLLKPDMSHLETWPKFFKENGTCVPLKWDLSDFDGKIEELLSHPQKREEIALAGQERYRDSLSLAGRERFCQRFINLIHDVI